MKENRLFHYLAGVWLIFVVSFAAIGYWADHSSRVYHETLFNEQQLTQVSLARRGLESHLTQIVDYVSEVSTSISTGTSETTTEANTWQIERLLSRPEVLAVEITGNDFEDQTIFQRSNSDTASLVTESLRNIEQNISKVESGGQIQFSELYLTPDTQLLGLAVHIETDGWLLAVLDLTPLLELYVAPMRFGKFGAGYALDGDGHIVYDHETEIIGRSVFDGMHDKYPILLELDRRLVSENTGRSEYTFTVERGGVESRKLIAWDTVLIGGQRLVVALSAPDIEVNASLGTRRDILIAAAVVMFLVLGGATILIVRFRQKLLTESNANLTRMVENRTEALNRELKARTESERKVRDFAEISSDWFWETNSENRFNAIIQNHASSIRLEMDPPEGFRRDEVTCEDTSSQKWVDHAQTLSDHKPFRDFRYLVRWEDGTKHTMSTSGKPIFDSEGTFMGYRGTGRDITEEIASNQARDRALEEANRANQTKSRFLATMSHELRTPLNAIMGFSDILAQQYFGPPGAGKYREYAKDIHSSAGYLLELVNDLLDMARIEAGKMVLDTKPVDIAALIDNCTQTIEDRAIQNEITIRTSLPSSPPAFTADPRAIKQVLLNLLSNAIRYAGQGGNIDITVVEDGGFLQIRVKDSGEGIPAEKLAVITQPFERGHDNPYETREGWGLGLSICNALVVGHAGHMHIDSVEKEWTEVTVCFPLSPPADQEASSSKTRTQNSKRDVSSRLRH